MSNKQYEEWFRGVSLMTKRIRVTAGPLTADPLTADPLTAGGKTNG